MRRVRRGEPVEELQDQLAGAARAVVGRGGSGTTECCSSSGAMGTTRWSTRNCETRLSCRDAGAGSTRGRSSRAAPAAASSAGRQSRDVGASLPAGPGVRTAEVARLAQHAVERADHLSRHLVEGRSAASRSSADQRVRVKSVSTRSSTRSTAAATGSAASGSDARVWKGMPASPERVRRQIQVRQRPLEHHRDTLVWRGRRDRSRRATAISSSSRSRYVNQSGAGPGAAGDGGGSEVRPHRWSPGQGGRRRPLRGPATSCAAARGNRTRARFRADDVDLHEPGSLDSRSKSATNRPSGSAIQSATVTTTCASGCDAGSARSRVRSGARRMRQRRPRGAS